MKLYKALEWAAIAAALFLFGWLFLSLFDFACWDAHCGRPLASWNAWPHVIRLVYWLAER